MGKLNLDWMGPPHISFADILVILVGCFIAVKVSDDSDFFAALSGAMFILIGMLAVNAIRHWLGA